jgi:membrane protein
MTTLKWVSALLKDTVAGWSEDHIARLSAAIAFYTVLSLAPLLVVAVAVASFVFGEEAARGQIAAELSEVVGESAGQAVQTLLLHAQAPKQGTWGSILGILVLLMGASGVFGELQAALNIVWNVEPKPGRGVTGVLRDRFFSFLMVMGVCFLLLVSLLLSAFLSAAGALLESSLPGGAELWAVVNFVISTLVIAFLFALIFKLVPDVEIDWGHVFPGALVTALLFSAGKYFLGLYLGRASVASPYGAAGSVVLLVIWVYYAAQILLLGAEFTRAYVRARGTQVLPSKNAVAVIPEHVADEGERAAPSAKGAAARS